MSTRKERSEGTRAELVAAATDLFAEHGFAGVGTEDVVRRAGLTRGALYHHFADKRELFAAVHERQERELIGRIQELMAGAGPTGAPGAPDPIDVLLAGMRAFLDACREPGFVRIALLDAPTVLGWARWREVDERYGLGLVTTVLDGAMAAGALRRRDSRPLGHLLLAALGEAAQVIAHADDPDRARADMEAALLALLDGLRA
ncbi:MAG TPA: TetR/AcrR family transcriptional regulator [Pseudonocardia sp.]|jgi:AcrR family transcriptional regulator